MPADALPDPTPEEIAALLPGTWTVRASNFPMWLSGRRVSPSFRYGLLSAEPLALSDDVAWLTPDGSEKHLRGVDRWTRNGLVWRGRKAMALLSTRWSVIGSSADGHVVVLRFGKSLVTPGGIDVIVRDGAMIDDPRAIVAKSAAKFGLSPEDFASLSWLTQVRSR